MTQKRRFRSAEKLFKSKNYVLVKSVEIGKWIRSETMEKALESLIVATENQIHKAQKKSDSKSSKRPRIEPRFAPLLN